MHETTDQCRSNSLFQIGIIENHQRRIAAKLKAYTLEQEDSPATWAIWRPTGVEPVKVRTRGTG